MQSSNHFKVDPILQQGRPNFAAKCIVKFLKHLCLFGNYRIWTFTTIEQCLTEKREQKTQGCSTNSYFHSWFYTYLCYLSKFLKLFKSSLHYSLSFVGMF